MLKELSLFIHYNQEQRLEQLLAPKKKKTAAILRLYKDIEGLFRAKYGKPKAKPFPGEGNNEIKPY